MRSSLLHANGSGERLYDGRDLKLLVLVGLGGASCLLLSPTGFNLFLFFLFFFSFSPDFARDVVWFSRDF